MKIQVIIPHGPGFSVKRKELFLYAERMKYTMSHFKTTCPNPHSGEQYFGDQIEGAIFDNETMCGLWVTKYEYDVMQRFGEDDTLTLPIELISGLSNEELLHKYRGFISSVNYNV